MYFCPIIYNSERMGVQRQSIVLNDAIEKLSSEASYRQLFHACREEEALPSNEVLKKVIHLCRSILFPGYYGEARISVQTILFHTGVNVQTLHTLLSQQLFAGLCFAADASWHTCPSEKIFLQAGQLSEAFIASLPEMRGILATDAEATYTGDPAAQDMSEVIFCYPGFRAIVNYRIAHRLYLLGVPLIPRMITEMAHSETGIDIHPGAEIGHHFAIDHGTGTVIGETSVIGNHVHIFQGVSLAGEKLPPDENGNTVRGIPRHPVLEDGVTIYSNAALLGRVHIGKGATIGGNVWVTKDVPAGATVNQAESQNPLIIYH
jgi:serine O-acetyltransferase